MGLTVVALIGAVATAIVMQHDGTDAIVAQRAIEVAQGLAHENPRTSASLAAAGHALAPSAETTFAALDIVARHPGTARAFRPFVSGATAAVFGQHEIVVAGTGALVVLDPATGAERARHAIPGGSITRLAASPLGGTIASTASTGDVALWDVGFGVPLRRHDLPGAPSARRTLALAFSNDGTELVAICNDGRVFRWDVVTRRQREALRLGAFRGRLPWNAGGHVRLAAAAIGADAGIATVATQAGGVARVDLAGRRGRTVTGSGSIIGTISAIAEREYGEPEIAVAGTGGVQRLSDGVVGEPSPAIGVRGIAFDGDTLVAASLKGIHVGDETAPHRGGAVDITQGPGGTLAIHPDGTIRVVDTERGPLRTPPLPATSALAFGPGGSLLYARGGSAMFINELAEIRPELEESRTDREVRTFTPARYWWSDEQESAGWYVSGLAYSTRLIASSGRDHTGTAGVMVWDARSGKPIKRLPLTTAGAKAPEPNITSEVLILEDAGVLAAYSIVQEAIVLWSLKDFRQLATIDVGPAGSLTSDQDEKTLAVYGLSDAEAGVAAGRTSPRIVFVDIERREVTHEVPAEEDLIRLAYSPSDGALATLSSRGVLQLLDADGRTSLGSPKPLDLRDPVDMAWSPDGRFLGVLTRDAGISLVLPSSGRATRPIGRPPSGTSQAGLTWSPDGRFLAATTYEEGTRGRKELRPSVILAASEDAIQRQICHLGATQLDPGRWKTLVTNREPPPHVCRRGPRRTEAGTVERLSAVYATADAVFGVPTQQPARQLARRLAESWPPPRFQWSETGSVTWVSDGRAWLAPGAGGRVHSWICPCSGVAFSGDDVVALSARGDALLTFRHAQLRPRVRPTVGLPEHSPQLLGVMGDDAIIAAYDAPPDRASPSMIYRVHADGQTSRIGKENAAVTGASAVRPGGSSVAYVSSISGGACFSPSTVSVVEAGHPGIRSIPMPAGIEVPQVTSLRWTQTGRLVAAIAPVTCLTSFSEDRAEAAQLYEVRQGRFVATGRAAYDRQFGAGREGTLRDVTATERAGTLVLRERGRERVAARGVEVMSVRP